ncbi:hypothetical protein NsoK4_08145 [Nitrosopumilus sp. K4]|uniref:hypothetical protein n=1 Tax=Nitrosopumilus sp. K4 TaxID=2795383 RepID=UPI001BAD2881|nr:hypothetical protein [Nitrosopumilus sp. K4]QUC64386.1 hypothetical protein NsoK4_08145 [Nitrosopumilus sp. K4]
MNEKNPKKCSNCGRELSNSKYNVCLSCSKSRLKFYHNSKIENLDNSISLEIDPSIKDLLTKILKTEDEKIKSYLKELLIIKLVSMVEIHFRNLMRYWYGAFNYNLPKLFPEDSSLEKKINDIRKIAGSTALDEKNPKILKPTKNPDWNLEADVVATSFNFQNLDSIGHVFSNLVSLDFFQTVKDLEQITGSGTLTHSWNEIEKLFELRHQVIHAGKKVEFNDGDLMYKITLIMILISKSNMFFDCYLIYDTNEENEHLFDEIGLSNEHLKRIMKKNRIY